MKIKKLTLTLIVIAGSMVIFTISYLTTLFWSPVTFHNEPLHSTVESIGALASILMGIVLIQRHAVKSDKSLFWMTAGLFVMGILDGLHAIILPGNNFVLFHSSSIFFGGLFFSFIWLSEIKKVTFFKKSILWFLVPGFILPSIYILLFPEIAPLMIQEGEFTLTAILLNVIGGFLFIVGSTYFLKYFFRTSEKELFWFFCFSLLLGFSGITFMYGDIWTNAWWIWHALRLAAFIIVLSIMIRNHQLNVYNLLKVIEKNEELGLAKNNLEDQVSIRTEELQELLYIASHDLQTPFVSMIPFLEEIRDDYSGKLPGEVPFLIERILINAKTGSNLVKALLDISRLNTQKNLYETFSMNDIIKNVIEEHLDMTIKQYSKNGEIGFKINEMPDVFGDKEGIGTVFRNLLSNAVKYGSKEIEIGYRTLDQSYFVSDNGIGVPTSQLEKIFGAGKRLKESKEEGSGMGLYFCRKVITRHNGKIWAESEYHKGTTLYFTLNNKGMIKNAEN